MAKRCIFFVQDNMLYKKTVEATWDMSALEYSKVVCGDDIFKQAHSDIQPCIDVSSNSVIQNGRCLNVYNVKNSKGATFRQTMEFVQQGTDVDKYPDSCYDLIYLRLLTDRQVRIALSAKSFYDIYYNPDKTKFSPAKALAMLQLLYKQNKLDYIEDIEKFVWWYYINGRPVEWYNK